MGKECNAKRRRHKEQLEARQQLQLLQKASLQSFHSSIFMDACSHAHYTCTVQLCFILGGSSLSPKIGPLKNFPLAT